MNLVIATGISGCGEKEFLAKWEKYCNEHGKRVKVFHTGDLVFKHHEDIGVNLNLTNVLNVDLGRLQTARSAVLKGILAEITDYPDKYDVVVICIHMWFWWNEIYLDAYDRFLKKFLTEPQSTIFVTFIDDFRSILARLRPREQWRGQKLDAKAILSWQNIEVASTYRLADFAGMLFYAVATSQAPPEFYKLIFHPELETVYVGMPISHLQGEEERRPIGEFVKKLGKYFTIFNPLSVEVVGAIHFEKEETEENDPAIHHHIAHRDLYWFLHFCDKMVAYWPKISPPAVVRQNPEILKLWPKATASPGLDNEMQAARGEGKDVWTVFLGTEASPFIIRNSTKLFLSEEEFFRFLDEKYPERKNLVW